jgi:hypothetical protein
MDRIPQPGRQLDEARKVIADHRLDAGAEVAGPSCSNREETSEAR